MIVLDNNALVMLYRPSAEQQELGEIMQRFYHNYAAKKAMFGIPTPALAEFLSFSPSHAERQNFYDFILKSPAFVLLNFDAKSAFCLAGLQEKWDKKQMDAGESWQKVKIDIQILAITVANSAEMLITHDKKLLKRAREASVTAYSISDLKNLIN